jgi:hypothetical protein
MAASFSRKAEEISYPYCTTWTLVHTYKKMLMMRRKERPGSRSEGRAVFAFTRLETRCLCKTLVPAMLWAEMAKSFICYLLISKLPLFLSIVLLPGGLSFHRSQNLIVI